MFKCATGNHQTKRGKRRFRVPVETREYVHPQRFDSLGRMLDPGGRGTQITREADFCEDHVPQRRES